MCEWSAVHHVPLSLLYRLDHYSPYSLTLWLLVSTMFLHSMYKYNSLLCWPVVSDTVSLLKKLWFSFCFEIKTHMFYTRNPLRLSTPCFSCLIFENNVLKMLHFKK